MENIVPQPPKKNNYKKTTTIIIAAMVIVLMGVIAYNLKNTFQTRTENETKNLETVSPDGLPTIFYSYLGTIKSIGENKLEILAAADKNYLKEDKTITVLTNGETVFIKQNKEVDVNKIKPGASGDFYQTTTIGFNDLKVGQEITVIDYKNVKGKDEFTAKRVEVTVK
ncbi:hypothetical protein A3H03_02605 [Candidatus Kuenenbacteria bacterium RIFCSPLOWO2_12_FULL_42_13]|uniref:DUF5666 domain-containing protein n=3 Tax=Candidatus Kueneniibacteriota TaxID=1752740 RepID=A0A0G0YVR9_9BACT|nr:MAG: hypothetical protein UV02_C0038G0005 [Candidatus Kuenenbacteria bacterium GW2011_GWA2_42_15]OGG92196.1 MAG: hypothetical protein A3H03_02605 [Candidatus Kuenenbacteria bacterium RIFCSPLOWO2_12_FULL_42_13]OGG99513.1 MAG: hypothetical protein A3E04_02535 [Candidatus Kuenenbacteria bacterium RIFCSPHIGHO2_12_FULL_42_14]